jgi:predicted RNA-binding protein with RPS1 domain
MSETDLVHSESVRRARFMVLRMALVWTPIALIALGISILAVIKIFEGEGGFVLMLVFFGFITLLTGLQASLYLRDLRKQPMEIEGEVVRKWTKANILFFLFQSYFINVDSRVCEGRVERIVDEGAYIRLESGAQGFCRRKDLDFDTKGKETAELVGMGQTVEYKVTGTYGNNLYRVSCRKALERSTVGHIFAISRVEYAMLLELDLVRVNFYPHSATVERLERFDESEKGFIPATTGASI